MESQFGQSQPRAKCTQTQKLKAAGIRLASNVEYESAKRPSSKRQKVATFAVKHEENVEENHENVLSSIEAFFTPQ